MHVQTVQRRDDARTRPAEQGWQAAELDATLIVVGISREHGLGRIVAGSVTEHALHGAPCAVAAVAPAEEGTPKLRSDGSSRRTTVQPNPPRPTSSPRRSRIVADGFESRERLGP